MCAKHKDDSNQITERLKVNLKKQIVMKFKYTNTGLKKNLAHNIHSLPICYCFYYESEQRFRTLLFCISVCCQPEGLRFWFDKHGNHSNKALEK